DVSMVSGQVRVRQLTATSGGNTLKLNGNNVTMSGNSGTLVMGSNGITYRDSKNVLQYEFTKQFANAAAFGTTTANIYAAASNNYEFRTVDIRDVPGDGGVNDYRYIDMRGKVGYFGGIANNPKVSSTLDLGADGYVRIMNNGLTTYGTLETDGIRTEFVDLRAGSSSPNLYLRPQGAAEVRVTHRGTTDSYADIRAKSIMVNSVYSNTSSYVYIRVDSEARVAAHASGTFRPIRASDFLPPSSEKYKTEIEDWDYSVLNIIKDETRLYRYKLTGDEQPLFRHGLILERETPVEMKSGDGINLYEMASWTLKGVQELAHENDDLKEEIKGLKDENK